MSRLIVPLTAFFNRAYIPQLSRHVAGPRPRLEHEGRPDGARQGPDHLDGLGTRPVPHLQLLLARPAACSRQGSVVSIHLPRLFIIFLGP